MIVDPPLITCCCPFCHRRRKELALARLIEREWHDFDGVMLDTIGEVETVQCVSPEPRPAHNRRPPRRLAKRIALPQPTLTVFGLR